MTDNFKDAEKSMSKHLWEIYHPYYMQEGCFYSNDCHQNYETFEDFGDDSDIDMNLVIRWDWRLNGEVENPAGLLSIYMMQQRKARPFSCDIEKITFEDEQAVIDFLKPHWKRLSQNWEGIAVPQLR